MADTPVRPEPRSHRRDRAVLACGPGGTPGDPTVRAVRAASVLPARLLHASASPTNLEWVDSAGSGNHLHLHDLPGSRQSGDRPQGSLCHGHHRTRRGCAPADQHRRLPDRSHPRRCPRRSVLRTDQRRDDPSPNLTPDSRWTTHDHRLLRHRRCRGTRTERFVQSDTLRLSYRDVVVASHAIAHATDPGRAGEQQDRNSLPQPSRWLRRDARDPAQRRHLCATQRPRPDRGPDLVHAIHEMSALVYHEQYAPHIDRIRSEVPTLTSCIAFGEHSAAGLSTEAWKREHSRTDLQHSTRPRRHRADQVVRRHHRPPEGDHAEPPLARTAYRITNQFTARAEGSGASGGRAADPCCGSNGMVALGPLGTRNVIAPSADPALSSNDRDASTSRTCSCRRR